MRIKIIIFNSPGSDRNENKKIFFTQRQTYNNVIFHLWLYLFSTRWRCQLEILNHFNFSQLFNIFQCSEMNWIQLCEIFQLFVQNPKFSLQNYVTAFELFSSNSKHKFKNLSTFFFCIVYNFKKFHFIYFKKFFTTYNFKFINIFLHFEWMTTESLLFKCLIASRWNYELLKKMEKSRAE